MAVQSTWNSRNREVVSFPIVIMFYGMKGRNLFVETLWIILVLERYKIG